MLNAITPALTGIKDDWQRQLQIVLEELKYLGLTDGDPQLWPRADLARTVIKAMTVKDDNGNVIKPGPCVSTIYKNLDDAKSIAWLQNQLSTERVTQAIREGKAWKVVDVAMDRAYEVVSNPESPIRDVKVAVDIVSPHLPTRKEAPKDPTTLGTQGIQALNSIAQEVLDGALARHALKKMPEVVVEQPKETEEEKT